MKAITASKTTTFFGIVGGLLLWLSARVEAQGGQVCPLCASPADLPERWDFRIQDGRSCRQLYVELGGMRPSDPRCQATKDIAQSLCCDEAEPQGFDFPPSSPPVYSGPVGDEPICPICGTLEYPGIPGAFIVARYVGEFTCDQLYGRGLNGMIPDFMCGPLTDFARKVCGCGKFNPRCINDPNQCYGAPGAAPTGNPPVASPIAQPVAPPVSSPVTPPTNGGEPTIFDRKTPPQGGKYSKKLSNGRGGAASVLRGGRNLDEMTELPEGFEFEFRVVEQDGIA